MTNLMASTLAWTAWARERSNSCCCWRAASTLRRARDCFSQACFCTTTRCCSACCLAASYLCRCCLLLGSSCRKGSRLCVWAALPWVLPSFLSVAGKLEFSVQNQSGAWMFVLVMYYSVHVQNGGAPVAMHLSFPTWHNFLCLLALFQHFLSKCADPPQQKRTVSEHKQQSGFTLAKQQA